MRLAFPPHGSALTPSVTLARRGDLTLQHGGGGRLGPRVEAAAAAARGPCREQAPPPPLSPLPGQGLGPGEGSGAPGGTVPPEPAPRVSAWDRECAGAHVCGRVFARALASLPGPPTWWPVARSARLSRRGRAWSGTSGVGGGARLGPCTARASPAEASTPDARPRGGRTRLGLLGGGGHRFSHGSPPRRAPPGPRRFSFGVSSV